MKAILIVTRLHPEISAYGGGADWQLPPLIDRPFLQHVLESIVDSGAVEINIILARPSRAARELIGDGSRWGVKVRFHENARVNPYDTMQELRLSDPETKVLLAHADLLPALEPGIISAANQPTFFCWQEDVLRWSGWALLQGVDSMPGPAPTNAQDYFDRLRLEVSIRHDRIEHNVTLVTRPLSVRTFPELIDAHIRVLQKQHHGLLLTGREIAPAIWVSRNATVHRTAKLSAPVFIGENCRVSGECQIGPGAAIGRDCLIDRRTVITNSIVCPGSYVGEALELHHLYVERNRFVNARLLTEVEGVDEVFLGNVYGYGSSFGRKGEPWTA